ncbi:hypothetical protein GCM10007905_23260 [Mixta theicola]|nr:hypothetical protein GCM10007905_23260 [Mixta theicola]
MFGLPFVLYSVGVKSENATLVFVALSLTFSAWAAGANKPDASIVATEAAIVPLRNFNVMSNTHCCDYWECLFCDKK